MRKLCENILRQILFIELSQVCNRLQSSARAVAINKVLLVGKRYQTTVLCFINRQNKLPVIFSLAVFTLKDELFVSDE